MSDANESTPIEAALLHDHLEDLFMQNADKSAVLIPTDLNEPMELILAGEYPYSDRQQAELSVQRRFTDSRINFLLGYQIETPRGTENYYSLIGAYEAKEVTLMALSTMTLRHLEVVRYTLQPGVAEWNAEKAQQLAESRSRGNNPYMWVKHALAS